MCVHAEEGRMDVLLHVQQSSLSVLMNSFSVVLAVLIVRRWTLGVRDRRRMLGERYRVHLNMCTFEFKTLTRISSKRPPAFTACSLHAE